MLCTPSRADLLGRRVPQAQEPQEVVHHARGGGMYQGWLQLGPRLGSGLGIKIAFGTPLLSGLPVASIRMGSCRVVLWLRPNLTEPSPNPDHDADRNANPNYGTALGLDLKNPWLRQVFKAPVQDTQLQEFQDAAVACS